MHDISVLGLASTKEEQLRARKIQTVEELITLFPRRYLDMRFGKELAGIQDGDVCAVDGEVVYASEDGFYPTVHLRDKNKDILEIVWFGNSDYYFSKFQVGKLYRVAGRISLRRREYHMSNPTVFFEIGKGKERIVPIHTKIKGMSEDFLNKAIASGIAYEEAHAVPDKSDLMARELKLMDRFQAIRSLHWPADERAYKAARKRMAFDILYDFYVELKGKRAKIPIKPDLLIRSTEKMDGFIRSLPFELTDGQKHVIDTLSKQALAHERIDTLVTGDVGCGKTIVAMALAMLMWENGFQTAILAPTLVLAKQHYDEMTGRLSQFPDAPAIALLTSETKKRERNKILKGLKDGSIAFLIGTSSILSDELEFGNLGMTIIDEEHKFGASQKEILEHKNRSGLHHISMSATPIPRSLARTVYGDTFGLLSIETMPAGRKAVITEQGTDVNGMFEKLAEEVKKGHQAYVICPFVSDSDSEQFADVDSVESTTEALKAYMARTHPQIRIDAINGRMKHSAVLRKVEAFAAHDIDILVSTTIVEVGVSIPNATAMLIMSADRFGLAALHQLRGRVGRSSIQSYCYLASKAYSEKLDILCHTNNGFAIAEADMELRGPGNLTGEEQTGYSEAVATAIRRPKLAERVRKAVFTGQA